MTNEAICIETPKNVTRYTVADGATIAKGTILKLSSDPNTAAASSSTDVFAGIAMMEKLISDGSTQISAATDGVFDLTAANAAITLGAIVSLSGANLIKAATAGELLTGAAFGKCLETASANEVVRVRIGLV